MMPKIDDIAPWAPHASAAPRTRREDDSLFAAANGTRDFITAEVALDTDWRKWNGGSQRDIVWMQRRPHLYGAFTENEPPVVRRLPGYPGKGR